MLSIKNLHAKVEDKDILNGINLEVKAGEVLSLIHISEPTRPY